MAIRGPLTLRVVRQPSAQPAAILLPLRHTPMPKHCRFHQPSHLCLQPVCSGPRPTCTRYSPSMLATCDDNSRLAACMPPCCDSTVLGPRPLRAGSLCLAIARSGTPWPSGTTLPKPLTGPTTPWPMLQSSPVRTSPAVLRLPVPCTLAAPHLQAAPPYPQTDPAAIGHPRGEGRGGEGIGAIVHHKSTHCCSLPAPGPGLGCNSRPSQGRPVLQLYPERQGVQLYAEGA